MSEHQLAGRQMGRVLRFLTIAAFAAAPAFADSVVIDAARVAIDRDPELHVVAVDHGSGTITVRVKKTGERVVVRSRDIHDGRVNIRARGLSRAIRIDDDARDVDILATGDGGASARIRTDGKGVVIDARPETGDDGVEPADARITVQGEGEHVRIESEGHDVVVDGAGRRTTVREREGDAGVEAEPVGRGRDLRPMSSPVYCTAGEVIHLDNVRLETARNAVVATGGCQVFIRGSEIVSDRFAVVATGGAFITVEDSLLDGRAGVASVTGGAEISAANSELHGRVSQSGVGRFIDRGGNIKR